MRTRWKVSLTQSILYTLHAVLNIEACYPEQDLRLQEIVRSVRRKMDVTLCSVVNKAPYLHSEYAYSEDNAPT